MKKIRVLKSFPTTHYGFLVADRVTEVDDGFADFAVKRMKAAEFITESKPVKPKKAKDASRKSK